MANFENDVILTAARKDARKAFVTQLLFIIVLIVVFLINRANGFLDSLVSRFV